MKVISVNIGERKTVTWRGKLVETGIFKYPVNHPITLESTDVAGDAVVDRRYHGGVDKACYLFSKDHYPEWKARYPDLPWNWGMFGENITVSGLDERKIMIGDRYKIGSAVVEVSQPRQPCYKLGIRFNTQSVLKDFIQSGQSGVYLRVIEPGEVKVGSTLKLIRRTGSLSVSDVFSLLYNKVPDRKLLDSAIQEKSLASSAKKALEKR